VAPTASTRIIPDVIAPKWAKGGQGGSAQRIVISGVPKIGKSTLAAYLPAPAFLDVEGGAREIPATIDDCSADDYQTIRGKLAWIAANPSGIGSVVVDTVNEVEVRMGDHVVQTKPSERGERVTSLAAYGWNKGWEHVYDEFNLLLADLDRIVAAGVHVCLVAHVHSCLVPNPSGADFIRWEPKLYSGDKNGKCSIKSRLVGWADHILFVGYDVHVQNGKGAGGGGRRIYTAERPTHLAGSRRQVIPEVPYELSDPARVWRELGIVTN